MEGIDAFGNNPSRYPLDHIAARPALEQGDFIKESLLYIQIKLICEIHRLPNVIRMVEQLKIGSRASKELEDEIKAIDEDEMADAEFALSGATKAVQLAEIEAIDIPVVVNREFLELGPVLEGRRDHGRDPAVFGMSHEAHFPAHHSAVEPL